MAMLQTVFPRPHPSAPQPPGTHWLQNPRPPSKERWKRPANRSVETCHWPEQQRGRHKIHGIFVIFEDDFSQVEQGLCHSHGIRSNSIGWPFFITIQGDIMPYHALIMGCQGSYLPTFDKRVTVNIKCKACWINFFCTHYNDSHAMDNQYIEPGHTKKWLPSSVNLLGGSIDRGISKPQLHWISINFQGLGSATPNGVQTWLKSWPASPWHFANKNRGKCSHWMAKIRGWNVWSYHILPIWALPRFLAVILSDFRHASVKSLDWWFRLSMGTRKQW